MVMSVYNIVFFGLQAGSQNVDRSPAPAPLHVDARTLRSGAPARLGG
jgi:hypothetical protein